MKPIICTILLLICLYEVPLPTIAVIMAILIYTGIPDIRMILLDVLTWYFDIAAKIRFYIALLDITGQRYECIPLKPPVRNASAYYIRIIPGTLTSRNYKILTWFYREHSTIGKEEWISSAALMGSQQPHYIELYDKHCNLIGLTIRIDINIQHDKQIQRNLDYFCAVDSRYLGSIQDYAVLDQLTIQGII